MSRDSRLEYVARMHRVIDHIDRHLDEHLQLEALAQVANFSSFHFHRLFSAWMGETLGEYVRRRRLELAAQRLVAQPRLPVLEVALAVGFGSSEAFARAFKSRFGRTPTAWRHSQVSKRDQSKRNRDQASAPARSNDGAMKVTIGRPRLGISHDDPGITAAEKLRYDAAVEVPDDFVGAGEYQKAVVPGGRYAMGRFKGTDRQVGEAWSWILRDWLPKSGMQLDARPCFEYYPIDATFDNATGEFECEITIPVTPL